MMHNTVFDKFHRLAAAGGEGWYQRLAEAQPWPVGTIPEECRWDVATIAAAATR